MVYDRAALARVLKGLREHGVDGVIIGSTVYALRLGFKEFEDDVDLFTTTVSPSFDEDVVAEAADALNCMVCQHGWGGPQLRCPVGCEEVTVELHENIYDFYVPEEMLNDAETVKVCGTPLRLLRIEDYLVLKAKAGREKDLEDLRYLSDIIRKGKLRINTKLIISRLALFDECDSRLIIKRLRACGVIK